MKPATKPRYEHDCQKCVFMGSFEKYDVWVCPFLEEGRENRSCDSLIARFSSNGPDYASFARHVFVSVVKNHLDGRVHDAKSDGPCELLPGWMLAILACAYRDPGE